MNNKTRDEIVSSILDTADTRDGSTKTAISFRSGIAYSRLQELLHALIREGYLQYINGEMKFRTTPKGLQFLEFHPDKDFRASCDHQCTGCGIIYDCGNEFSCRQAFSRGRCALCTSPVNYAY